MILGIWSKERSQNHTKSYRKGPSLTIDFTIFDRYGTLFLGATTSPCAQPRSLRRNPWVSAAASRTRRDDPVGSAAPSCEMANVVEDWVM
jgi:hypothetical protein